MPKMAIQRGDKLEAGVYSLPTPERVQKENRQQMIDKLRTAFRLDETDEETEEQIEDENTYD